MRVTKAQAERNRSHVIEVASRLFREKGIDGIGLNDLMKAAGLTRGAFYGQFDSKEALVVEASAHALAGNAQKWSNVVARAPDSPFAALVRFYLSGNHRHAIGNGCALSALGAESARHAATLPATFEAGVESYLDILEPVAPAPLEGTPRDGAITALATMLGALLLSRAVKGTKLSQHILDAASRELIARSGTADLSGEAR